MDALQKLKKYDLHCHLDGSLSAVTIRKLAEQIGLELEAGGALQKRLQVQEDCKSLKEYLMRFDLPLSCLVTKENFKTAAAWLLQDVSRENVVYIEIRFAPLLSVHEGLSCRQIIESTLEGLQLGKEQYGVDSRLIICGMRHMPAEENAALVDTAREFFGSGVTAMDLAGDEAAFPVKMQSEMFLRARKLGMPFTIHAGECKSSQSVWDALELGASRIGHGIAVQKDEKLKHLCGLKKIPLEMCPTSNLQTKAVESLSGYPFLEFLEAGIPVTINTDNRTVSNTTITKELEMLQNQYHITYTDMEMLMENARTAAFV